MILGVKSLVSVGRTTLRRGLNCACIETGVISKVSSARLSKAIGDGQNPLREYLPTGFLVIPGSFS